MPKKPAPKKKTAAKPVAKPTPAKKPAPKVDASGEFSSGSAYAGFEEFRRIVKAERTDAFTRHLIRQFLSYATGRHMEPVDDPVIEQILDAVKADGYGVRTLLVESLASEIFRSR